MTASCSLCNKKKKKVFAFNQHRLKYHVTLTNTVAVVPLETHKYLPQ